MLYRESTNEEILEGGDHWKVGLMSLKADLSKSDRSGSVDVSDSIQFDLTSMFPAWQADRTAWLLCILTDARI